MPVLLVIIFVGMHNGTLDLRTWGLVILLYGFMFLGAGVTRQMGLNDAEQVAKVSPAPEIKKHELRANIFVGTSLLSTALAVCVILFSQGKRERLFQVLTFISSILTAIAGVAASHSGGELVYFFDAIKAWSLSN
jgi:hypothetical protein